MFQLELKSYLDLLDYHLASEHFLLAEVEIFVKITASLDRCKTGKIR